MSTSDDEPTVHEEQLVAEFRAWLSQQGGSGWRQMERHRLTMEERARASRHWEASLGRAGWLGLTWPHEYGGRDLSLRGAALIARELSAAGAPELFNQVGLDLVGPAIIEFGTREQKERLLPGLLRGQVWCQGFSEPDAGSDLASLKTRAERRPGGYVISGQKVWSTFASQAEYCLLLARTDPSGPRHKGITCFLMPMETPGIDVRPIREITGDAEFFELFLDGCELSDDDVLGRPGIGWEIAMHVLSHERNSIFSLLGVVHKDMLDMIAVVRDLPPDAPGKDELQTRAVALAIAESVVQWSNLRATDHLSSGTPEARLEAVMKVSWSEVHQEIARTAVETLGVRSLLERQDAEAMDDGRWLFSLLHSRAETIYAGTSEIQRNIIAERTLGLPREPRS